MGSRATHPQNKSPAKVSHSAFDKLHLCHLSLFHYTITDDDDDVENAPKRKMRKSSAG